MDRQRYVFEGMKYALGGGGIPVDGSDNEYAVMGLSHLAENDPEVVGLQEKFNALIERVPTATADERDELRVDLSDTCNELYHAVANAAGRIVFESSPEAAPLRVGVAA